MVYTHGGIAQKTENTVQGAADSGRRQMPYMKGFGNVDRGIIYTHGFTLADIRLSVILLFFKHLFESGFYENFFIGVKIEVTRKTFDFFDAFGQGDFVFQFLCHGDGRFA